MMPVSLSALKKIAAVGGVAAIAGASFFSWKIQDNFRREVYYVQSVELLKGYPPAIRLLGEPIKTGRLDLSGTTLTYSDGLSASLSIPVRGSKERGRMQCFASRASATDSWTIDKLDLEIKDRKWTFYVDPNSKSSSCREESSNPRDDDRCKSDGEEIVTNNSKSISTSDTDVRRTTDNSLMYLTLKS